MMMKTFGFSVAASSAVLVALLASGGCSSSTPATGTTDAATDGKPVVKADGGDSGPTGSTCPGAAPTKADLDSSGGWKPPPAKQSVCSAADLAAFDKNFGTAATYADIIKGLPAACGSCLLNKETDATWNFLVTDDKGELGFVNYGACYARAANGSDACGKAIQYSEFCVSSSCAGCASDTETTACESDTATTDACSANFAADISAGCGTDQAKLTALDDACGTAVKAAAVLCGGGTVGDAGGGG